MTEAVPNESGDQGPGGRNKDKEEKSHGRDVTAKDLRTSASVCT